MALYITVNNIEGHDDFGMRTRQSLEPLEPRDGEALIVLPDVHEHPDGNGTQQWDRATRAFVAIEAPPPPPPLQRVTGTKVEFSDRIGFARESILNELIEHPDTPRKVKADLRTMIAWLNRADNGVTLTDPRTEWQVQTLASVFSNATLMALVDEPAMTEQEAAAYVAAVLTPWTEP